MSDAKTAQVVPVNAPNVTITPLPPEGSISSGPVVINTPLPPEIKLATPVVEMKPYTPAPTASAPVAAPTAIPVPTESGHKPLTIGIALVVGGTAIIAGNYFGFDVTSFVAHYIGPLLGYNS